VVAFMSSSLGLSMAAKMRAAAEKGFEVGLISR
jgi:hypothetical protein